MKILFDASVFKGELTGVAKSTKYLYDACRGINPNFMAYGIVDCDLSAHNSESITMINIREFGYEKLADFIKEQSINVIHYPNNGGISKSFAGLKKAVTIHDVLPLQMPDAFGIAASKNPIRRIVKKIIIWNRKREYIRKLQNDIYNCDVIFTISDYSFDSLNKYFKVNKPISIIQWGPCLPEVNDISCKEDESYILYWGGYAKRKGILYLVKAFDNVCETNNFNTKLVIVGKKYSLGEETDGLIKKGVLSGKIIEKGYVTDEELVSLIKHASALFFLSSFEGFGLPIIEAMKLGCPVVTTKRTSLPEIGGEAVLYVEPENIEEVSKKILQLSNDGRFREKLSKLGKEQAKKFSWEKAASTFLETLQKI